ncbi:hypothetical protein [Thiolapillus sp.]|uniref:hypothetical protein n=1 Tax=Thiolapillus sp. TaxID=2017437 RepID=UPI003AF98A55
MASKLIPTLKQLKLYGMATACEELLGERPRKANGRFARSIISCESPAFPFAVNS